MFSVKFGTPKPVSFREYYEKEHYTMDVMLEARFAGTAEVSDYDSSRYGSDADVDTAIKKNCTDIISKCLNERYPDGEAKVREYFKYLDTLFEEELAGCGITATVKFFSKSLTQESESAFNEKKREEIEIMNSLKNGNFGWDVINPELLKPTPAGKYRVGFSGSGFSSKSDFFAPGEEAEVFFDGVASDMAYSFWTDTGDVELNWELVGGKFRITFTMPAHNVRIICGGEARGAYLPGFKPTGVNPSNLFPLLGMMSMDAARKAQEEALKMQKGASEAQKEAIDPGNNKEWDCPKCGTRNAGKFCYNCGDPRP